MKLKDSALKIAKVYCQTQLWILNVKLNPMIIYVAITIVIHLKKLKLAVGMENSLWMKILVVNIEAMNKITIK